MREYCSYVSVPALAGPPVPTTTTYPATTGGTGNLTVSLHLPAAVSTAPVARQLYGTYLLANGDATADTTGTPSDRRGGAAHSGPCPLLDAGDEGSRAAALGEPNQTATPAAPVIPTASTRPYTLLSRFGGGVALDGLAGGGRAPVIGLGSDAAIGESRLSRRGGC